MILAWPDYSGGGGKYLQGGRQNLPSAQNLPDVFADRSGGRPEKIKRIQPDEAIAEVSAGLARPLLTP